MTEATRRANFWSGIRDSGGHVPDRWDTEEFWIQYDPSFGFDGQVLVSEPEPEPEPVAQTFHEEPSMKLYDVVNRNPPRVSIIVPDNVFIGDSFWVHATAEDDDNNLAWLTIRWQGHGVVQTFDLNNVPYTAAGRRVLVTAPAGESVLNFRAEVRDKDGQGYETDWQSVRVVQSEAPDMSVINTWVETKQIPTSTPGVMQTVVEIQPSAPSFVQAAIASANLTNEIIGGLGGLTSDQVIGAVAAQYRDYVADQAAQGQVVQLAPGPVVHAQDIVQQALNNYGTVIPAANYNPVADVITNPTGDASIPSQMERFPRVVDDTRSSTPPINWTGLAIAAGIALLSR